MFAASIWPNLERAELWFPPLELAGQLSLQLRGDFEWCRVGLWCKTEEFLELETRERVSDCIRFTRKVPRCDMDVEFGSDQEKSAHQEHYVVVFGGAGIYNVYCAFVVAVEENAPVFPFRSPGMACNHNGVQFFVRHTQRLLRG